MLVSDIETFLKKKKKTSVNMVVGDIRILSRMSIEIFFVECKKWILSEYKTFFIISTLGWSIEYNFSCRKVYKHLFRVEFFGKHIKHFSGWFFFFFSSLGWKSPQVLHFHYFHSTFHVLIITNYVESQTCSCRFFRLC